MSRSKNPGMAAALREDTAMLRRNRELHRQRLAKMHAEGLPASIMAERMGMEESTVRYILREIGLKPHKPERDWPL